MGESLPSSPRPTPKHRDTKRIAGFAADSSLYKTRFTLCPLAIPLLSRDQQGREQPKSAYPVQNRPEQFTRNGDFRQLERHVSSVTDYLRPELDELVSKRRQRPMAYPLRQRQPTEEIAEIVGQREKMEPYLIVHEVVTGEPRSVQGVFAFFDPLFRGSPTVVELDDLG